MHRLIRRSIETFLGDTYGQAFWRDVAETAGVNAQGLISDLPVAAHCSQGLMATAARRLDKPESELLEDLGAWLARLEPIRRLLRFSGREFPEFLLNLVELPDHVRLVVPDLGLPEMRVTTGEADRLRIILPSGLDPWTCAIAGVVRAMADDYGALALISVEGNAISVQILDGAFAEGRAFRLGEADLDPDRVDG